MVFYDIKNFHLNASNSSGWFYLKCMAKRVLLTGLSKRCFLIIQLKKLIQN